MTKPDIRPRILFTGPAGCGKSRRLIEIFEKRLKAESPLEPASYFIVPSREHAERVIRLLVTHSGVPGFFSGRVTTLDELIEQSFEIPNPPATSNMTRITLMRRLLSEGCGPYFEKVRLKPGFLNLALDFITELKEFCWTPASFREEMNRLKKAEPDSALKYEGLAALYENYQNALTEMGLRDRRDTLNLFRAQRSKGTVKALQFHTLCLDGFFDFTPLQMEALSELAGAAQSFAAALTWDAGRAGLFSPVTATQKAFLKLGFEIEPCAGDLPRFKSPDLEQVSRALFLPSAHPAEKKGDIERFDAPDPETEAEMIARRILDWTGSGQCRPSDIAVLMRSVRDRRAIFESVFRRFGIPAEIHERERLSESEWIQTAARFVRFFREGWRKDDGLGFLRSSFVTRAGGVPKDEKWLHGFEAWLWQKGLRENREMWKAAAAEDTPAAQSARVWIESFEKIETEWRSAKTAGEWSRFFKKVLERDFGMLAFLTSAAEGENWGVEAAAPGRLEKILEELESLNERGKEAGDFDRFADDFLRLVDLDLFSLPRLNQNAVQVYDVSLARQKEYEVVFVAGLAEKQFPVQAREDALLSDWERRLLAKKPYGLDERKSRQMLEKYLFYIALTRARSKLYLSHARRDEEGKSVLASFYLDELDQIFKGGIPSKPKKDTQPYPDWNEVLTEADLQTAAVGSLFNPWEAPPDEKEAAAFLRHIWQNSGTRSDLRKALWEREARIHDGKILAHSSFALQAPSPTGLEKYARCSFLYFAEKILKLQPLEEDTRTRDQGTLMHNVLELFFKNPGWRLLDAQSRAAWLEKELKNQLVLKPLSLGPYQASLSENEMIRTLLRFTEAEIERLAGTPYQPAHCEYEIPRDKPAVIERDGIRLRLQGKIDRVDVNQEDKTAVISDYKRGKSFKKDEIESGTSLQLPLYLLAVQELLGLKPAGGQLLSMKEGKASGFFAEKDPDAFEAVLTLALRYARRYLDELAAGRIAVRPRDCDRSCSFSAVCRIEKWRLPEIAEDIRAEDMKLGFKKLKTE